MRLRTLLFLLAEALGPYFLPMHSHPLQHRAGADSGELRTIKSEGPGLRNTSWETTIRHLF